MGLSLRPLCTSPPCRLNVYWECRCGLLELLTTFPIFIYARVLMSSVLAVVCWPRMRELHFLSCETARQLEMVSKIWVYRASALEGEGTWQCWVLCDPSRVLALRRAASRRLALQFGDLPPTGTDSDDSPRLRIQRDVAVRRRVLCGLVGWNGYTSYAYDFEFADSDEGDPLLRSFVIAEQVSAFVLCAPAVDQTLSELLSSNPGLAASLLSYLLTFRSWVKFREVCTRCKHVMEHNQILWAGLSVFLHELRVPASLWASLAEVLRSAGKIYVNVLQAGFAVSLRREHFLVWGWRRAHLSGIRWWNTSEIANYFFSMERSAPGITLETKVLWSGPLLWLDIGFQHAPSVTTAHPSHAARCQIQLRYAKPELCDDRSHPVACVLNIAWFLSSFAEIALRQNVKAHLLLAPAAGVFEIVVGLAWLPDAISLVVNGNLASCVRLPALGSFDPTLLDPFLFLALPAVPEIFVQLVPLRVLLQPGMVAPWCSICAEEDPRRCSGRCHCGRFYCSLHGGACFFCEREACGFCLLDHATCT